MKEIQSIKQRFGIIGNSSALDQAILTAIKVANTDLTVLITGESGTGKEVFSRIIHANSARKHNKFIAINCGAIPKGTINSELFGHEKGSFTGAAGERKGYFETYDKGTVFLDEIGELPLDTQAYLLRILENKEYIRVGSSTVRKTDVRVIAATNVNLEAKIKSGKFREDLFYRLNIVPISLPALRERREDIYMLFRKFSIDFSETHHIQSIQIDEEARALLENYTWPGNIRELKNVAEQLTVLSEKRFLTKFDLIELVPKLQNRNLPSILNQQQNQSFQEREILYKLLFEMKADVTDLKKLIFELIKNNDLQVSNYAPLSEFSTASANITEPVDHPFMGASDSSREVPLDFEKSSDSQPYILNPDSETPIYQAVETFDEDLSLESNTKTLIIKALKKHNNKRKEAANDLGISERTLYRKIREYGLEG